MLYRWLTELKQHSSLRIGLIGGLLGAASGILLWNGFMYSLDATSTNDFCISCHSMNAYVYQDYQHSIHARNSKGIQAGCADCHVPKPLAAKLVRKTIALNDIYHTILGTIDTPEKYAARKQHLAERIWNRMRATDSRECRNCHRLEQMDYSRQSPVASRQHQQAKEQHKTCIDCHHGVAHPSINAATREQNSEDSFSLE